MIILNSTTDLLQAVMGASATTTQPDYHVSFIDCNLTNLVTGNRVSGVLNGTTPATLLTGTTDQLTVKNLNIYNADTVAQTITVQMSIASSVRPLYQAILVPGSSLHYEDGAGFYVTNTSGNVITGVQTQTLTGDVTGSGTTSIPTTLVATSNSTLTTLSALSLPGSQITGNIGGNAANITATSNSTLTTLSALSLPGSQVTGNISGNAANITATSNSTLTTLSALSLPGSQVSGNISGNAASITGSVTTSQVTGLQALIGAWTALGF